MITRILHTKIWKDGYFSELLPAEKLLFIYFITNERVNIIHCYEVSDREIAFDTGIDRGIIKKAKVKFESSGRMYFFHDWVLLRRAYRYETYSGKKNEQAKEKLFQKMSEPVLAWYNKIMDTPIDTPMDTMSKNTIPLEIINHNTEIINQKSETKNNNTVVAEITSLGKENPVATVNEKGIVKKTYWNLEDVVEQDFEEIANHYHVPLPFVRSKYEDMVLWAGQQPKNKKLKDRNWRLTLMNWVKHDAIKIAERSKGDPTKRGSDARDL